MTISTTSSVITYQGNGATTVFTFPFVGVSSSDLYVTLTDSTGAITVLNPSTYTVSLNTQPVGGLWGIGGSVTYPLSGSPISTGSYLSIIRDVPFEQTISINNQGAFYPTAVEQALDLLELQIQQLNTDYTYTLKTPVSDPQPPNTLPSAAVRANGILGFDNSGQPIILSNSGSGSSTVYGVPRKVITTGTATVGMTTLDSLGGISIYQSGSPVTTVQLPEDAGPYPVFDASLNAGTYPIKILPPAGLTIMGQTSYSLVFNGQSATFYNDGTQILIG